MYKLKHHVSLLHLLALGSLCASMAPLTESTICPAQHFTHGDTGICTPCTVCPINHIVRQPCSEQLDTLCSRFYEFQHFEQGPNNVDNSQKEFPNLSLDDINVFAEPSELGHSGKLDTNQTKGPTVQDDGERWRVLCFALIGALAFVSLCSLLCILFLQLRAKRAAQKHSPADIDSESAVYVHLTPDQPDNAVVASNTKFVHLETQLAKNKQHTHLLQRLFHPRAKFIGGNEYVDHLVNPGDGRGAFIALDTIPESDPSSASDSVGASALAVHGASTSSHQSRRSCPSSSMEV